MCNKTHVPLEKNVNFTEKEADSKITLVVDVFLCNLSTLLNYHLGYLGAMASW